MGFLTFTPTSGDTDNVLLQKIVQILAAGGGALTMGFLKVLPTSGDTDNVLLQKIVQILAGPTGSGGGVFIAAVGGSGTGTTLTGAIFAGTTVFSGCVGSDISFCPDNTWDIGTSGARPKTIRAGTSVGIGINTPARSLHVVGTGIISERNSADPQLVLRRTGDANQDWNFRVSPAGTFIIRDATGSNFEPFLIFANSPDSAFTIGVTEVIVGIPIRLLGNLIIPTGANARAGNAVLVAGTVTVANTSVTANTVIMLTRKTIGGVVGNTSYTVAAGASFTINSSSAADTSTMSYFLIENP